MKGSTLRCGIIGAGSFAHAHGEAIAAAPTVSLAAVSDVDRERARAFADKWGGRAVADADSLLAEGLDIVTIASPDETHATFIAEIVQHPRAPRLVIVEKPLCTSAKELEGVAAALGGKKTRLVVDHTRRFNAGFQQLKGRIDAGEFGKILSVHWQYYAGWLHIGVHAVDTLRMFLGELACTRAVQKSVDRYADDPLLDVTLESRACPEARIFLEGLPEHPYKIFEADMRFSAGRIRIQWEDVFIDRTEEDSYAPTLRFREHFTVEPVAKALEHLYEGSAVLLRAGDERILDLAGFETARATMEILFSARDKAGP
jgi:myo-inositol 2-dehydrogenase/D-chiro-inositol 1-dehydrogenase